MRPKGVVSGHSDRETRQSVGRIRSVSVISEPADLDQRPGKFHPVGGTGSRATWHTGAAAGRAAATAATVFLVVVAVAFLVAAGLVALTAKTGFTVAALVFAAVFAVLAIAVYFVGRVLSARRAAKILAARNRAAADIALTTALARSARPLAPLAAFVAAFVLARRL